MQEKLKKTLAAQLVKHLHKFMYHNISNQKYKSLSWYSVYFVNWIFSGHLHLFPHEAKSSAAKFTARKELEWR